MSKNLVIFVHGLRGGIFNEAYYDFINEFGKAYQFKNYDKVFFRLKSSWNKNQIEKSIRQKIKNYDDIIIIGNSLGAQIAERFIGQKNIDVYYVCPALGLQVLNLPRAVKIITPLVRIFCKIYILLSFPFRNLLLLPTHPNTLDKRIPYSRHAFIQQIDALITPHAKQYKTPKGIIAVENDKKVLTSKLRQIFPQQIIFSIQNGHHSNFRYDNTNNRYQFEQIVPVMLKQVNPVQTNQS